MIINHLTSLRNNPVLRNPDKYKLQKINAIILHTTGVFKPHKAETVVNNFNVSRRYASAHYVIKENTVINCVPTDSVAYHCGGAWENYTDVAFDLMEDYDSPNYTTLGIEMVIYPKGPNKETIDTTLKLCAELMMKYEMSSNSIFFHRHLTGKMCPRWDKDTIMSETDLTNFRLQAEENFWEITNLTI